MHLAIKRVRLSDNVIEIGSRAFADCPNLTGIYIPYGCKFIADDAFDGVENLTIYTNPSGIGYSFAMEKGFQVVLIPFTNPPLPQNPS